ncbi:MAG: acyl-ACP--UDP-N-acetylglucosamine O-acyltransferase [Verrucomicrobiales bacterium]|nr:acyl-ACP--UDP-N-acetylglucosamine O-acyltransferase [Verrucomicrobiota bacterium JB025]
MTRGLVENRSMIHPTAIVSPNARIGNQVRIGPFCVVGADVEIGDGCVLHSHVVIEGHTKVGKRNEFFPFAAIGGKTQDLKYVAEPTFLVIGDDNVFRENTTVHRSTHDGKPTTIGSNNLFLCYSHVAHDCQLGNHIILSNSAGLSGHIVVEDHAIVSGMAGVHQFCRIGAHAMVGGFSKVVQDVPPFMIVDGNPAACRAINSVGLQRRGFSEEDIKALKAAYKRLFLKKEVNLANALSAFKATHEADNAQVKHLIEFVEESARGVTR